MKLSPIKFLLSELSKITFSGPATESKLAEYKKKREEVIKNAMIYEIQYHKSKSDF